MSTINQTVPVEPNSYAVGQALAKFVTDVKASFSSGNTVAEAMAIAQACLTDLVPAIGAMNHIAEEAKADPLAEATTVYLTGLAIYSAIIGKKA